MFPGYSQLERNVMTEEKVRELLTLILEGGSHEPKNVGSLLKLERQEAWNFP